TVRRIALYTNDTLWMEHLEAMDYLRSSVNLRAYGQREPIVEYKKDGLQMFKEMEEVFKDQVFSLIMNINVENKPVLPKEEPRKEQIMVTNEASFKPNSENKKDEVGRNDLCPCGSGKKYKKCHGA
ncbi:MAG: preprotein translocase subunit SecA, partial [Patescibacteria group bacterium]|nr:preprotein translocase subunit SecA [Patescibacteria group bacterium]